MEIKRNYPILRFISGLYIFLATVSILVGILVTFNGRGFERFTGIIIGAVGGITFFAASEILKLFIHIEENTRRTANLLDRTTAIKSEVKNESPYQQSPTIQG